MLFTDINTGKKKIRTEFFPPQFYGDYEKNRLLNKIKTMIETGVFSFYRGNAGQNFWGGKEVRFLELEFEQWLADDSKCLTVNSCTSALIVACGAIGIQPGDEVIATPWSMSCSATAPMIFGGIPVFADIEEDFFCIDPEDIEKKITDKTKAIIVVDLFGNPADWKRLYEIADKYNIWLIEDAAQAVGAIHGNRYAGTLGDIGCFSFTQGKHMTAGEGGMVVVNKRLGQKEQDRIYQRCALLRNHAEAVENDFFMKGIDESGFGELIGMNLRMTEIQAMILREQFKNIYGIISKRKLNINRMREKLPEFLSIYPDRENCKSSYYVMPIKYDKSKNGNMDIRTYVDRVKANLEGEIHRVDRGIPINAGYVQPLYKIPLFQRSNHWSIQGRNYKNVFCKNAERLNDELIVCLYHSLDLTEKDIEDLIMAFKEAKA